jgi:hypothetical protein
MTCRKIEPVLRLGEIIGYLAFCPGCRIDHLVHVRGPVTWQFNDDFFRPTFTPSVLVRWEHGEAYEKRVCHSYITNGQWQFLGDCSHELAGKTVDMLCVEDEI